MYPEYTQNRLLRPLVRCLTKPQRQNLIVLILAVQWTRSLIPRRLALYLICAISRIEMSYPRPLHPFLPLCVLCVLCG